MMAPAFQFRESAICLSFFGDFFRAFCSHKNGAKFRNNEVGKTHFVKLYIFWRNPGFSELLKMEHFQSLLFIFRHFHKQRNGKINFLVFFSPFKNHYKFKAKKCEKNSIYQHPSARIRTHTH